MGDGRDVQDGDGRDEENECGEGGWRHRGSGPPEGHDGSSSEESTEDTEPRSDEPSGPPRRPPDTLERAVERIRRDMEGLDGGEREQTGELPHRIDDFEVLRLLGRGGMGEVYLARQVSLDRLVALKILPEEIFDSPEGKQRFLREARLASSLDHPNIVKVHATGTYEGRPYIAMQYIEGETLAEKIAKAKARLGDPGSPRCIALRDPDAGGGDASPPRRRRPRDARALGAMLDIVTIIEKAARALHVAHTAGLIHRDIKPSNIMVTPEGEPILIDFGLARSEEPTEETIGRPGGIVGTLPYMSPEQIDPPGAAGRAPLDRRTDVYGLGITGYECLTLTRPFEDREPTFAGLVEAVTRHDPPSPRLANPAIPPDLATVVLTAIERDRDRRYRTAQDFAEDLGRVRMSEPIQARSPTTLERARRWARRSPAMATGVVASFTILALALVGALALWRAAQKRAAIENDARLAAEGRSAAEETARRVATAWSVLDKDPASSLLLLLESSGDRSNGTVETALFATERELSAVSTLSFPGTRVNHAVLSPDGTRFAAACEDGNVFLWSSSDFEARKPPPPLPRKHQNTVHCVAFSPDGKHLFSGSQDGEAWLWDAETRRPERPFDHFPPDGNKRGGAEGARGAKGIQSAEFSPDGRTVATGCESGAVYLWEAGSGALLWRIDAHARQNNCCVRSVDFSPDGSRILSASDDSTFAIWDAATGALVCRSPGIQRIVDGAMKDQRISCARYSPDGTRVATATNDRIVRVWDARDLVPAEPLARLFGHEGAVRWLDWSPDGSRIASGAWDQAIRVWDVETGTQVDAHKGHTDYVRTVRWSADGKRLLSAAADGTVRLWDVGRRLLPWEPPTALGAGGNRDGIARMSYRPSDDTLATVSEAGAIVLWRLGDAPAVRGISTEAADVRCLASSADGARLVTGHADGKARLWAVGADTELVAAQDCDGPVLAAAFSPDGARVALGGGDSEGFLLLWDPRSGERRVLPRENARKGRSTGKPVVDAAIVAIRGGADVVVFCEKDSPRVMVWRPRAADQVTALKGHDEGITSLVAGAAPGVVVTASKDGTARLWHVGREECTLSIRGGLADARYAAVNPSDGRWLLIVPSGAKPDLELRAVKVFDTGSGRELFRVESPKDPTDSPPTAAAFVDPDGRKIAVGHANGQVWIWEVPDAFKTAEAWKPRELTAAERERYGLPARE